jgi:outer membrane protein assembly factor BamD
MFNKILLFVAGLLVVSCSFNKDTSKMTADEHFKYALELYNDEDYFESENEFRTITMRYSGQPIADDAQFYLAETYFQKEEYLIASSEYARLVRSMPNSPFVEEASYKIGLSYFNLSPRPELDQTYTNKAIRQFQDFISDYPGSKWAVEAEKNIHILRNKLARKMLESAYIYRRMEEYDSAIIYLNLLLERYYNTDVVDEALYEKGMVYLNSENWKMVKDILIKLKSVGAKDLYNSLKDDYIDAYQDFFGEVPEEFANSSK